MKYEKWTFHCLLQKNICIIKSFDRFDCIISVICVICTVFIFIKKVNTICSYNFIKRHIFSSKNGQQEYLSSKKHVLLKTHFLQTIKVFPQKTV